MTDKPHVLVAFSEAGSELAERAQVILREAGVPFHCSHIDSESEGPHMLVLTDHGSFQSLSAIEWYLQQLDDGHFSPTDASQGSVDVM